MLRAFSMSNLEHNSRAIDIKQAFSFYIRLRLSGCFYFSCLCSFTTLLSIEENAFDKHGVSLHLLV